MKTILLAIGKTTDKNIQTMVSDYAQRINHYSGFDIQCLPELRNTKSLSEQQQKLMEATLLKGFFQSGDYIVLLDEHGRQRTSSQFATWLEKRINASPRRLIFVIGGPYGFAPEIHQMANEEISLSPMTFSHQMIRLIFTEQLYRAHTILKGQPYHHE